MSYRGIKTYNELSSIPKGKYEGYIWMSDATSPKEFNNENFEIPLFDKNFIIEGLLWDKDQNKSITIKHGHRYMISECDLSEFNSEATITDVEYISHRIKTSTKLCFKRIWISEVDNLCNDMAVLKMKAQIFCGFKNN